MNLENNLNLAVKASLEAGKYLKNLRDKKIISNIGRDIKLVADKISEEIILAYLKKTRYSILSEENGFIKKGGRIQWIVDPLDGSFNFYRGIPNCAVSVALWRDMEPLIGIIYDFNRNNLYKGIIGQSASLNNKKIQVSNVLDKNQAVICTGFPSHLEYLTENLSDFYGKIKTFKKTRLLGSATLSLAYVASGKADAYHEKGIRTWDVAAGLALVKAAGGSFQIERLNKNTFDVFASNGSIKK